MDNNEKMENVLDSLDEMIKYNKGEWTSKDEKKLILDVSEISIKCKS